MPKFTPVLDQRQQEKAVRTAYREAADRLYPNVTVSSYAHVQPVEDGAFVEVVVWVPKAEALHGR